MQKKEVEGPQGGQAVMFDSRNSFGTPPLGVLYFVGGGCPRGGG